MASALQCDLRSLPIATSLVEGKLGHAIRVDSGHICPRQILEALEALDAVPLPARYAARALDGGVALEILVRDAGASTERQLRGVFDDCGVPVRSLRLVEDSRHLQSPLPRRCDLHEPAWRHTKPEGPGEIA